MKINNNLKETIYSLLLFLAVCALLFVLLEIFLRVYKPFEFRVKGETIILPVNKKYVMHNSVTEKLDKKIIHVKNSLGFRGKNPPEDFDKYLTIMTVGGSTTECFAISDGKTWTDVLGEKLKSNFSNLWINNAGLDGQSSFGHIILMENYIVKLKPKVVIFLVGLNDSQANSYNQYDKKIFLHENKIWNINSALMFLADRSDVIGIALNIYRWFKAYNMGLTHAPADFFKMRVINLTEQEKADYRYKLNQVDFKPFEERLMRLINLSRQNGITPFFVTQPAMYGKGTDDETALDLAKVDVFDGIPGELVWERLELTNDVIRKVSEREQVPVINLSEYLPKNSRNYIDLVHYSNEGNKKVAEILYKEICQYLAEKFNGYLIKECAASEAEQGSLRAD